VQKGIYCPRLRTLNSTVLNNSRFEVVHSHFTAVQLRHRSCAQAAIVSLGRASSGILEREAFLRDLMPGWGAIGGRQGSLQPVYSVQKVVQSLLVQALLRIFLVLQMQAFE
jgi:hypothetical protein